LVLTTAPIYVVLHPQAAKVLPLDPPPAKPRRLAGKPSPVVLQPVFPKERTLLWSSAYRVSSSEQNSFVLTVYNFHQRAVEGVIRAVPPRGWNVEGAGKVTLEPMGRLELPIRLVPVAPRARSYEEIRFVGTFGDLPRTVASVRIAPDGSGIAVKPGTPIPGADEAAKWHLMVSGGPTPTAVKGDGVLFEAAPTGDPWFYPRLTIKGKPPIPRGVVGLACTIHLLEGEGIFRAIFDEANGSSYVSDFVTQPQRGVPVRTVALFSGAVHGAGWSQPDPNGGLDPDQVVSLKIGCNTKGGHIRFALSDVRWVNE